MLEALIFWIFLYFRPKLAPVPFVTSVNAQLPLPQKPASLAISEIGLSAAILEAGLNEKNLMWVPDDASTTSWWKYGARPGQRGNVILAGHYTVEKGNPGVFFNLDKLRQGSSVEVIDEQGIAWEYVIESLQVFEVEEFPTQQIYGHFDDYRLTLITCAGKYLSSINDYSHRLVISAKMAQSQI